MAAPPSDRSSVAAPPATVSTSLAEWARLPSNPSALLVSSGGGALSPMPATLFVPSAAARGGETQMGLRSMSTPSLRSTVSGVLSPAAPNRYAAAAAPSVGARAFAPAARVLVQAGDGTSPREYADASRSPQRRAAEADNGSSFATTLACNTTFSPGRSSPSTPLCDDYAQRPNSKSRSKRLYADALARRQRQQEKKDESERAKKNNLEECKRQAWLEQRDRQRFYRFRDHRTHQEREDACLRRREERVKHAGEDRQRMEEMELDECTFHPKLLSRTQDARRKAPQRSASCSTLLGQSPQDNSFENQMQSPRGAKLQKILVQHQTLIYGLNDIAAETELGRTSRTALPTADHTEADKLLYKQNLEVVHALERLDMQVLDLQEAEFNLLLARGYRLGLGEKGRRGLTSPREAQRQAAAESSPRNNLRQACGSSFGV